MIEKQSDKESAFSGHRKFLARSTFLLVMTTVASRVLGMAREIMVAKLYGATADTDAFFFAYNIPELVRTLLISGALSSVFIPIFTEVNKEKGEAYAKRMSSEVFGFVFFLSLGVTIVGIIATPLIVYLAQIVGMGKVDKDIFDLTVSLTRMIFPILIFIALSGLCQGILNSLGNFRTPAFAPFLFNAVIIVILLLEDVLTPEARIQVAVYAFIAGALAQLMYQLPRLYREGIKFSFKVNLKDPVYNRFLMLAPAAMLGYGTMVVNSFVDKSIGYALAPASLSALTYGFRVEQLPFSIFGVSVATTLFPSISRYLAEGMMDEFKRATAGGIRIITFTVVPAMVIFLALKHPIIQLLFQRGAFDEKAVTDCADSLFMYTLGIVPASILLLIARVFFAGQDMKTPLRAGIVMVALNFVTDIWFAQPEVWGVRGLNMGFKGIALSTSIVTFINLGILVLALEKRYGGFLKMFINLHVVKILIAAFFQYASAQFMYWVVMERVIGIKMRDAGFMPVMWCFLISVTVSFGFYMGVLILLRAGELKMIREYLFRRSAKPGS